MAQIDLNPPKHRLYTLQFLLDGLQRHIAHEDAKTAVNL